MALQESSTATLGPCGPPDQSAGSCRGGHAPGTVRVHAGDPLNEAADALASAVAELNPSRSQEMDPKGVYFRYRKVRETRDPGTRRGGDSVALPPHHDLAALAQPGQEDPERGDVSDED